MNGTVNYILSYDAGTSGIKAVLVGTDGSICASATAGYSLLRPQDGWAEQIPAEYWDAACRSAHAVLAQGNVAAGQVIGVIFATQWKGMIPLDAEGNVLHNSIIWMDTRGTAEAQELAEKTGLACATRDYWTRLLWFKKNHPDLYAKTVCFLEANSYLKYRATGSKTIDQSNHFTRSPLPKVQAVFDAMLAGGEIAPELFPPVVQATDEVGWLTAAAAQELGLKEGTPVFGGLCDIPAVTIGAGAGAVGAAHVYLGTSGWIGVTRAIGSGTPRIPVVLSRDRWAHVAGMQSACMSYDWCLRTFYKEEMARLGDGIYGLVEEELSEIPAGSLGLTALPSLNGEGGPFAPTMRAGFVGLTAAHDRRYMVNAVLEGICCILRLRKAAIEKNTGEPITRIHVVGGGAGSPHWMQMLADVLRVEVIVPENARYAGALGAAYCAMIGLGLCGGFEDCAERAQIKARYLPREDAADVYDRQWPRFWKVAQLLGNVDE